MSALKSRSTASGVERWLTVFESDAGTPIEVIETPTSWVLLTSRHAYKVKKAVDIGDVHYGTPAQRLAACKDEVWLNHRLADSVYLGVVPITRDARGALRLGGNGVAVEWAVKMRRLPEERSLRWLIEADQLAPAQISALAARLSEFYRNSPPHTDQLDNLFVRLEKRVNDERFLGLRLAPDLRKAVREIRVRQHAYLLRARMVLNLRVCDGRVVDGHGDLRPEHVFFERQPAIIDCVEYSAQRRRCDALDDLSGLTMECRRLGRDDLADALRADYCLRTGDDCFPHLEAFYRSLHACDRARTAAVGAASRREPRGTGRRPKAVGSYLEQAKRDVELLS